MSTPAQECGLLAWTESLSTKKRNSPEIIDEIRLNRKMPLIVENPDRHGTGRRKDFITSYVNEAIGLKL